MKTQDIIDLMSRKQKARFKLLAHQVSPKDYINCFLGLSLAEQALLKRLREALKNDLRAAISKSPRGNWQDHSTWTVEDVRALLGDWPGMPYVTDHDLHSAMVTVLCS